MDAANNDQQPRPSLFSRLSNFQIRPSTYLLLLAFMFFMFVFHSTARAPKKTTLLTQLGRMSGSGSDPRTEHRLQETITRKHAQHDRYRDWLYHNASHWQPPPSKDNTTVELPPWNQTFALQQWSDDKVQVHLDALHLEQPDVPHWKNLTGFLKGQWEVMDIQHEGNETKWKEQRGDTFDWRHGKFEWNVRETERDYWSKDDESPSTFLRGTVDFYDQERTDGLDFDVLHESAQRWTSRDFLRKFLAGFMSPASVPLDIRHIPALVPQHRRNATSFLILDELSYLIKRLQTLLDHHQAPQARTIEDPMSNCTFALWAQLQPFPEGTTQEEVDELERELKKSDGRSTTHLPRPSIEGLAWSQDCGLVLKLKESSALPMDMFWWKTVSYSAFMAIVGFLQTILTVRQMESTSTPNSIARVSYWTISLQGGMDSYSFVTHLTLGSVVDPRASYALLLPAFFAALSGLLFGLRYAASIRVATAPSPAAPPPPPPSAAQNAGQAAVRRAERNENEDLPEEETAPPSQVESAWRFFWRPDSPAWLFLFVGAGSLILYIIISIGILPCAVAGIYSFWLPQIYLNAYRGSARRSLKTEYVTGTTLCRLALPLYVWGCPDNVLFTKTNNWVWVLLAYQLLQMSFLLLQGWLGARFFVRPSWDIFPEIEHWDYHPAMAPADVENPEGVVDCVICLERIELRHTSSYPQGDPDVEDEHERDPLLDKTRESLDAGRLFGRYSYMVPPCHHIAHTKCLEQWLAMKSECPVCRRHLPAP